MQEMKKIKLKYDSESLSFFIKSGLISWRNEWFSSVV